MGNWLGYYIIVLFIDVFLFFLSLMIKTTGKISIKEIMIILDFPHHYHLFYGLQISSL